VIVLCRCRPLSWRTLLWLALPVAVGLGVALLWPFFPLFRLSPSGFYATSDELFYQSVPQRVFPALLGLIVVYRRTRADWRDPEAWLIGTALVLYGVGYWSGIGRPIIFAVLLLQIAVGDGLGRIEAAWRAHHVTRWEQGYAVAFGVLALSGLVFLRAGPVRMIPEEIRPSGLASKDELAKVSDTYEPVGKKIDDGVVMVSDTPSIYLPAFGGKLVSSDFWENPLAADDIETRREATNEFFRSTTADSRRREILDEYGVSYIVLFDDDRAKGRLDDLQQMGAQQIYKDAGVVVLSVPSD
jgi:hypothetical protein